MSEALPHDLAEALAASVADRGVFGARLFYAAVVGSTNDLAAQAADRGEPEGTTFVAGAQTAGRGRLGRTWFSPPDAGLYI
jgi:BirA family biotin operon repressor/biotin-[acetyl-CoA-carboxylase] ligase